MAAGNLVAIRIMGDALPFSEEPTTADSERIVYTITNRAKQIIDPAFTPTVETSPDGEIWDEAPGFTYTLQFLKGQIIFDEANPPLTQVRISGQYIPTTQLATAHEYTFVRTADLGDITRFGDTWRRRQTEARFATGTVSEWDVTTDTDIRQHALVSTFFILEIQPTPSADYTRLWAFIERDELQAAFGNPQKAVASFVSSDEVFEAPN